MPTHKTSRSAHDDPYAPDASDAATALADRADDKPEESPEQKAVAELKNALAELPPNAPAAQAVEKLQAIAAGSDAALEELKKALADMPNNPASVAIYEAVADLELCLDVEAAQDAKPKQLPKTKPGGKDEGPKQQVYDALVKALGLTPPDEPTPTPPTTPADDLTKALDDVKSAFGVRDPKPTHPIAPIGPAHPIAPGGPHPDQGLPDDPNSPAYPDQDLPGGYGTSSRPPEASQLPTEDDDEGPSHPGGGRPKPRPRGR